MYIFEIQKFIRVRRLFRHVGYLNKIFLTKEDACDYYDYNNKHMKKICRESYKSDWDPVTQLRYVIRDYDREILFISEQSLINLHAISRQDEE